MYLVEILEHPEGKAREFKRDLSSPDGALRTIVAFANTADGNATSMIGALNFFPGVEPLWRDVIARKHGLHECQAHTLEVLSELDSAAIEDAHAALPEFPQRTLQRDLQMLVGKGIAVAEGAARARRYRLQNTQS
jgi:hypothetical protein